MQRMRLAKGLIYIEGQRRLQLMRKLVNGKYQLESEDGEIVNISFEDMLTKWRTAEWIIDILSLGSSTEIFFLSTPADFASLPIKSQKIIRRRKAYLEAIRPEINKYNREKWNEIICSTAVELNDCLLYTSRCV